LAGRLETVSFLWLCCFFVCLFVCLLGGDHEC
jgi:hypothetical protein